MCVLSLIRSCSPTTSVRAIRCSFLPTQNLKLNPIANTQLRKIVTSIVRSSGDHEHRNFTITPSRYTWTKYKDSLHFYIMLGLIPGLTFVFLINVFIGPAKLTPIPEGYEPKQWEYFKHPITRWLARYFFTSHQEDYERTLFYVCEDDEKRRMRFLQWRVEELMAYRGDYLNYYVRPTVSGKYFRYNVQDAISMRQEQGFDTDNTSIPGE